MVNPVAEAATVVPASAGVGPLLERNYWAVVAASRLPPTTLMAALAQRFCEIAPPELAVFTRAEPCDRPLDVGDELAIQIALAGACRVRVANRDEQTLTLATLPGHPEAGRITFGAYRNAADDVVFHIRSRARASCTSRYLGYIAAGEAMQTSMWADFIATVAVTFGEGVKGDIHAETREMQDEQDEGADELLPTFRAVGG